MTLLQFSETKEKFAQMKILRKKTKSQKPKSIKNVINNKYRKT